MKLEIIDNIIVLYLKPTETIDINFNDLAEVEGYFRDILLRLKDNYGVEIAGFYNINVFIDKEEGMVFRLEKDNVDYCSTFHQLEIRMLKEETTFFYEIEDLFSLPLDELDVYIYCEKIYVRRKTNKKAYLLYEFGKLIYENTNKIIINGKKMTSF